MLACTCTTPTSGPAQTLQKPSYLEAIHFRGNLYAQNTVEYITVYVKDGIPKKRSIKEREQSKLSKKEWMDYTKQVWNISVPHKRNESYGRHPALMPTEIVRRCVRMFSFMGRYDIGSDVWLRHHSKDGQAAWSQLSWNRHIRGILQDIPRACHAGGSDIDRTACGEQILMVSTTRLAAPKEYLDQTGTDPSQEQRMELQQIIRGTTPENLGSMLEALKALAN